MVRRIPTIVEILPVQLPWIRQVKEEVSNVLGAPGTGSLELELDSAVLIPDVDDVTPILLDSWTNARVQELLDKLNRLAVPLRGR